jgi:hypothetical protein
MDFDPAILSHTQFAFAITFRIIFRPSPLASLAGLAAD